MIRIKAFEKISIQKKDNFYVYLCWDRSHLTKLTVWHTKLHISELDQINIGPTSLVEWLE